MKCLETMQFHYPLDKNLILSTCRTAGPWKLFQLSYNKKRRTMNPPHAFIYPGHCSGYNVLAVLLTIGIAGLAIIPAEILRVLAHFPFVCELRFIPNNERSAVYLNSPVLIFGYLLAILLGMWKTGSPNSGKRTQIGSGTITGRGHNISQSWKEEKTYYRN